MLREAVGAKGGAQVLTRPRRARSFENSDEDERRRGASIRKPDLPRKLAEQQAPLYNFLLNKWYFDEVYHVVFVQPAKSIGRFLWKRGDGAVIDGGINGVAMGIIPMLTRLAGRAQSGYVFTYAFAMVIGIAVILTYFTIAGGYE